MKSKELCWTFSHEQEKGLKELEKAEFQQSSCQMLPTKGFMEQSQLNSSFLSHILYSPLALWTSSNSQPGDPSPNNSEHSWSRGIWASSKRAQDLQLHSVWLCQENPDAWSITQLLQAPSVPAFQPLPSSGIPSWRRNSVWIFSSWLHSTCCCSGDGMLPGAGCKQKIKKTQGNSIHSLQPQLMDMRGNCLWAEIQVNTWSLKGTQGQAEFQSLPGKLKLGNCSPWKVDEWEEHSWLKADTSTGKWSPENKEAAGDCAISQPHHAAKKGFGKSLGCGERI